MGDPINAVREAGHKTGTPKFAINKKAAGG
jgi:hypothetical protein